MQLPVKPHNGHKNRRRISLPQLALGIALAGALQAAENLLPPLLPWMRLGLANVITLTYIFLFGPLAALIVTVSRYLLGGLITGFHPGIILGVCGGLASWLVMVILYLGVKRYLGIISISVAGACCHMTVQFVILGWWCDVWLLQTQLPLALFWAYGAGLLIGIMAWLVVKRLMMNPGLKCHR